MMYASNIRRLVYVGVAIIETVYSCVYATMPISGTISNKTHSAYAQQSVKGHVKTSTQQKMPFLLGTEVVTHERLRIAARFVPQTQAVRIGLITNQTGKDQRGRRTIDLLRKKGVHVVRIFVPEHGLNGTTHASCGVADSVDSATGIPVVSLYGNGSGKVLHEEQLKDLDLLVFELQDSGMRHYTYISTLFIVMKAAAQHNKPLVILDRPNPLKHGMEGPLVEAEFSSFISIVPVPVRHGMTLGELARYFNKHILEKPVALTVVAMRNYNRLQGLPGNLTAPLSPFLQTKQACYGYAFLGLLGEVRPFDMGLGTEYAMRCIGLPESVHVGPTFWSEFAQRLKRLGIQTRPLVYYSARKKARRTGLLLTQIDPACFSSMRVLTEILTYVYKAGVPMVFSSAFDKAAGTAKLREYVQSTVGRSVLARHINDPLHHFFERAKSSFLYTPFPHVIEFSEKD